MWPGTAQARASGPRGPLPLTAAVPGVGSRILCFSTKRTYRGQNSVRTPTLLVPKPGNLHSHSSSSGTVGIVGILR